MTQESRLHEIRQGIQSLKIRHHTCEDSWYSCPKSGECSDDRQDKDLCNCGAAKHNAKVDELLRLLDSLTV